MSNPLNSIELEQNCNYALKMCDFAGVTGEDCASKFCNGFPATSGTCPQLGLDPQNCCGSSDPATCLADWVQNGGGAAAATPNVCASVVSIIAECSSADPDLFPGGSIYTSGPQATSLAACMCYDQDGTYDPDTLDGFASNCVASGVAAHPTYYKYGSLLNGFCTENASPAGAAASTTSELATSSSIAGGGAAATTTTAPAAQATTTTPTSTKSSQQAQATSSPAVGATSSKAVGSSASLASSQSAGTTTTNASSGVMKNTFKVHTVLLLGLSILLSFY